MEGIGLKKILQQFLRKRNIPKIPNRKISIFKHRIGNYKQIRRKCSQNSFIQKFRIIKLFGS
jgi:hypothetical protein